MAEQIRDTKRIEQLLELAKQKVALQREELTEGTLDLSAEYSAEQDEVRKYSARLTELREHNARVQAAKPEAPTE